MDLCTKIGQKLKARLQDANRLDQICKDIQDKEFLISERLDYLYNLLKEYDLLEELSGLEEAKNDAKSLEFRQKGNTHFSKQECLKALEAYNQSICFAESQEYLAIGLANRSAVLFEMQLFRECLESIRLARETGVPDRILEKLNRREEKCQQEIERNAQKEPFVTKIDLPVNEKIPFLANCLSLKESKKIGRHVITEEAIPAGTVIAIEEPFAKILVKSEKYLRCCNCLKEVPHLLMPCKSCTQTMFCSKECQEEAQSFHTYECGIISTLFKMYPQDYQTFRIIVRIVIQAFSAFSNNETMLTELKVMEKEKKTIFSFDWRENLSAIDRYTLIHTLTTDYPQLPPGVLQKNIESCVMFHILRELSREFRERFLTSPEAENMLKSLLFKHMNTVIFHGFGLSGIKDPENLGSARQYGVAVYGLHSLIIHSCVPNVTRKFLCNNGMKSVVMTAKNIKAGQPITCSYPVENNFIHHGLMKRYQRQQEIMTKYDFVCECVACLENFPLVEFMSEPKDVPYDPLHEVLKLPFKDVFKQIAFTNNLAENNIKILVDFIHEYGHRYPTKQVYYAEERLKLSLEFLYENINLELRENLRN